MFALLALGGDIGCSAGPGVVGFVSAAAEKWLVGFGTQTALKAGLLAAALFPVCLTILLLRFKQKKEMKQA